MIILDTNVLSATMLEIPDSYVISWLNSLPAPSVWLTSVTIFEIRFGIDLLPEGRRKVRLQTAFEKAVSDDFENRVLPFDHNAAEAAGQIAAHLESIGRRTELPDMQIAGIATTRNATLATRNIKHFEKISLRLMDPWTS